MAKCECTYASCWQGCPGDGVAKCEDCGRLGCNECTMASIRSREERVHIVCPTSKRRTYLTDRQTEREIGGASRETRHYA